MSKAEILKRFGNVAYITAEDLYLSIRTDGAMYETCINAARKKSPRQRRRAFDPIIRQGWKNYKLNVNPKALIEASSLPIAADLLYADIMAHYWESYTHELPVIEAYWITTDVITDRGRLGYVLMWGNPYTAIGVERAKSVELYKLVDMVPKDQVIYRVKLARIYGEMMVTVHNRNARNRWDKNKA